MADFHLVNIVRHESESAAAVEINGPFWQSSHPFLELCSTQNPR
jgi:hypothetical protein